MLTPPTIAQPTMTTERIVSGLARPVFATTAPGDANRFFIVEQRAGSTGSIKILNLSTGSLNATNFLDIPGLATLPEQGLLGLAFHPDYQTNGLFYVNITTTGTGDTEIREYKRQTADLADASSVRTVMTITQPDWRHNGGWMGFGPDGYLYIASGDGGGSGDPGNNAQDITNNKLGKILRIDPLGTNGTKGQYGNPPDNPFVGVLGDDEIWAYGLRNPWRCSFDWQTGDLYIADVGQGSREEINVQPVSSDGGENYGWRVREGTAGQPLSGAIDPIYDYTHGTGNNEGFSVIGGYVYRGPINVLRGHYFFADFISNRLWSLKWDGTAPSSHNGTNYTDFIDWTEKISTDLGTVGSVSSFAEDASGNLYIISLDGEIFKVVDATIPTLAAGQKVLDGVVVGGVISDLSASDDVYQNLDPSQSTNPAKQKVDVILQSIAGSPTPQDFSFRVESKKIGGPVGDVIQRTRMFNYQTSRWELLDTRAAPNQDERITIQPTGDLTRFVQAATREITARVTWTVDGFSDQPFFWSIDIDEAVWPVTD
jgi:hypothetical protein